jgi:hypothetical protein
MLGRWVKFGLTIAALLPMLGCGKQAYFVAKEEPWRADEERRCLASGYIRNNPYISRRSALGGPSPCGAIQPLYVAATAHGVVELNPPATVQCPMVPATDHWVVTSVMPAARRYFGMDVVELKVAASYACRPRNGIAGGVLSEHGLANALDIAAFRLADGREVSVLSGWNGNVAERAFLRAVHRGACRTFTTVLGPNADRFHRDHLHLDLARHGRSGAVRVCR